MMMERAKTAPAPDREKPVVVPPPPSSAPATQKQQDAAATVSSSAEDRVQDLERRLNLLDSGMEDAVTTKTTTTTSAAPERPPTGSSSTAAAQTGKNNPLLKRIQAAQERARLAERKEREAKVSSDMARAAEEERARIQKAQSALRSVAGRALEENKQKSILAQLEGKKTTTQPHDAAVGEEEGQQQRLLQQQQQPTAAVPIMKTLDRPPPSFDSMKFPPPAEMQQRLQQPHIMQARGGRGGDNNMMVGHGMNSRALSQPPPLQQQQQQQQQAAAALPPPSFDFVEKQILSGPAQAPPPAPTAPTISPSAPPSSDHLIGIMPVAPPPLAPETTHAQPQPPPPSFAAFEQHQQQQQQQQHAPPPPSTAADTTGSASAHEEDCDAVFDYDLDGNPLSSQQRTALLDEQRLLYESIMREKAANDAAIARAEADAFDLRSSNAAARAMTTPSQGGQEDSLLAGGSRAMMAMDSLGRDNAAAAMAPAGAAEGERGDEDDAQERRASSRRMVKIGNNQMVALHGQDRTKKAIKEGTAILVQCMNCQNWMQVTDTATLMFCPVCQVVSPVIQQNEVLTKEEAIQLTMDRKLAEKLQQEAYGQGEEDGEEEEDQEDGGFLSNFFTGIGGAVASSADAVMDAVGTTETKGEVATRAGGKQQQQQQQESSWWNKISSVVSYGVADDESKERGDMGVTLPPGGAASEYPAQRRMPSASSRSSPSAAHTEETRGLLSPVVVDGNEANLPSARVAESKPLFSCVMDSMSSAASAVFTGGDDDENTHGVDSSSLLVTNAGRGVGDGTGDYSKLPDRE
eukprot:CAMPEP_0181117256 /NCGR_PEP_ID=MMETSP1071-20121207/22412_1 /TAXON_ID=35127 /ORGANISM="Thalassiosira sp., Strain NH16" /LENGTH=802 /DNA_ID=CAMNT_0023201605 /DNA_START=173 /DNA_END=2581 /DNA_ORIENTATION=+